jgi:lipid-A-disaccharide synthase
MKEENIFVFAGETSADLYGAMLLVELQKHLTGMHFWGVGGPSSRGLFECVMPMEKFQVMGITDVLAHLPRLVHAFFYLKKNILLRNPKMVIIIDQPSFGIKLAKSLRKAGYTGKIVQFVAPTVWAWKKERAKEMATYFDLLLTLFDFEPAYFEETNLKTVFVGHPIVELIEKDSSNSLFIDPDRPILALFPGSRPAEIKRNLPLQLKAAELFCRKHPVMQVAISAASSDIVHLPKGVHLVPFNARYELMKKSYLAIAKSGTVTLELALHEVPTVVTYSLTKLNYLMARFVMKVGKMAYFSLPNILCKKEVFYERIVPPVSPEDIAECLELVASSPRDHFHESCKEIKKHVTASLPPIQSAAKEICALL